MSTITHLTAIFSVDDGLQDFLERGVLPFALYAADISGCSTLPTVLLDFTDDDQLTLMKAYNISGMRKLMDIDLPTKGTLKPLSAIFTEIREGLRGTECEILNGTSNGIICRNMVLEISGNLMTYPLEIEKVLSIFQEQIVEHPTSPSEEKIEKVFQSMELLSYKDKFTIIR